MVHYHGEVAVQRILAVTQRKIEKGDVVLIIMLEYVGMRGIAILIPG